MSDNFAQESQHSIYLAYSERSESSGIFLYGTGHGH